MKTAVPVLWILYFLTFPSLLSGQAEVFDLADFELRGPVQSCTVITDYGEERFEFDREGKLTKSLTRYNDSDYDITYYRYLGEELAEKRDEVYRNGTFDESTSFARFYRRDTLQGTKVVEKITSYDQKILEQITYQYDTIGRLQQVSRVHDQGVDQTEVRYSSYRQEQTAEYFLNGQLQKSERISAGQDKNGPLKISLLKEFYQDTPQRALERTSDSLDRVLSEVHFTFDADNKTFRKAESHVYSYNEDGFLSGEQIVYYRENAPNAVADRIEEITYIYQQDGKTPGNWIRKVVTPENSFTTRRISYYPPESGMVKDSMPNKG